MNTFIDFINTSASYVGPFFILLGLLIFVHELGHFLVAKYFGVRVEVFSLGFGKKIFQIKRGDTNYCVSLIPLGGYVKMYGDDPSMIIPENERQYAFLQKPVMERIAIVLAGPLMNLFFAAFIFSCVAMIGENLPAPIVGDVEATTTAYSSGFRSGMTVLKINDTPTATWDDISNYIKDHPNQMLNFLTKDVSGIESTIAAKTELIPNDNLLSSDRWVGGIKGLDSSSKGPSVGISDPTSLAAKSGMESIEIIKKINNSDIKNRRDIYNLFESELFLTEIQNSRKIIFEAHSLNLDETKADPPTKSFVIELDDNFFKDSRSVIDKLGFENSELFLFQIKPDSPAHKAGFLMGDKLVSIDGIPVTDWDVVVNSVKNYSGNGKELEFTVSRAGVLKQLKVVPQMTELMKPTGAEDNRYTIGIVPSVFSTYADPVKIRYLNPITALKMGVTQSIKWTQMVSMSFIRMIQNEVSSKNIGGVITIGKFAGQSYQIGIAPFLKLMAIISINLFIINLLPVPILDGGHLLFFTIEAIRGAPLSMRKMEIAQQVGLIILMSLMVFALFNDISNILNPPW